MQPKPIESRNLLDIDAQKRLVDMEGIPHLRSVREHKEHPAKTDYDIIHDEAGRRNREEDARKFFERLKKSRERRQNQSPEAASEAVGETESPPNGQKGAHLDIEA